MVKPHPNFMLFATQNPPGTYGGRKVLSRAFRNRFLEIHVGEIPSSELECIIQQRCAIASPFAKAMVEVMNELQMQRQQSKLFAGKDGFITPRDLLKWAERQPLTYKELAVNGYRLLAERVRNDPEKAVVQKTIEKFCKVELSDDIVYQLQDDEDAEDWGEDWTAGVTSAVEQALQAKREAHAASSAGIKRIVWTKAMKRVFALLHHCVKNKEPVLLVGATGIGKTTVCQFHALFSTRDLVILNCHQNTETADIIGSLRPVRAGSGSDKTDKKKSEKLFEWQNGPLVNAMLEGNYFLLDEISLADDAVLERINSVLEPSRTLLLAEKGGSEASQDIASACTFRILATMNPGGDFGKKELSPALRNRFTEVWIPAVEDKEDLERIVADVFASSPALAPFSAHIVAFLQWCKQSDGFRAIMTLSLRDLLEWAGFMKAVVSRKVISPWGAYIHGAALVILDGVGLGTGANRDASRAFCERAMQYLLHVARENGGTDTSFLTTAGSALLLAQHGYVSDCASAENISFASPAETGKFGVAPFCIPIGDMQNVKTPSYSFKAPTTAVNLPAYFALCSSRPILMEGSPGVGKTSLVSAIAKASGHNLVRINLSEQTDFVDLIGTDMPCPESASGFMERWRVSFWRGGRLCYSMSSTWHPSLFLKASTLASITVEWYKTEIDKAFVCPPTFRILQRKIPCKRAEVEKAFQNRS